MSPGSVGDGSWMTWRIHAYSLANDTALHSSSSFVASFAAWSAASPVVVVDVVDVVGVYLAPAVSFRVLLHAIHGIWEDQIVYCVYSVFRHSDLAI